MVELIFDFDGTLVDGCGHPKSWLLELARSHRFRGSDTEALRAFRGCTDFDVAGRLGIEDRPEEFTRTLLQANRSRLKHARCHPDLQAMLRPLAAQHTLHVLSDRDQESLEAGVENLGEPRLFGECVGSAPGVPGKPDPFLYERLRRHAPAPLAPSVYIGDKEVDRELATRTGTFFVAALWYHATLQGDRFACCEPRDLPACLEAIELAAGV